MFSSVISNEPKTEMSTRTGIPRYRPFDGPVLFRQGFRPFFLGAGIWGFLTSDQLRRIYSCIVARIHHAAYVASRDAAIGIKTIDRPD
jgi:hypothetical protein